MTNLLIIPLFAIINRIRGMDFKGHRIVAAVLAGSAYTGINYQLDIILNLYQYLIISLGYWLWSAPAWLPTENWSWAIKIRDWVDRFEWYRQTVIRQLWAIPCFALLGWFNHDVSVYYCAFIIIFGWGICYYTTGPNCINLSKHTEWAELLVGALWGLSLWLTLSM